MLSPWKRFLLLLAVLFLFTPGVLWAQTDPDARAHAWAMYEASGSGDTATFERLFANDPSLTKRAFVSVLEYIGENMGSDPQAASDGFEFAVGLAEYIGQYLGDPVPGQIMSLYAQESPQADATLERYVTQLYSGVSQPTVAQAPEVQPTGPTGTGGPPANTPASPTTPSSSITSNTNSTSQATDSQGMQHAWALYEALQSQNSETFQRLFSGDPDLTKRAFVSTLEYVGQNLESDPDAAAQGIEFAAALAQTIGQYLNDPVPQQIISLYGQESPQADSTLMNYANQLYPAYSQSTTAQNTGTGGPQVTASSNNTSDDENVIFYGQNKIVAANIPQEAMGILRPFFKKITRLSLAVAHSDPELILQEIDSYPIVVQALRSEAIRRTGKIDPDFQKDLDAIEIAVEQAKVVVLADIGLTSEFERRALALAAQGDDVNNTMGLYLTGFRMSNRQQQNAKAQEFLNKAEALAGQSSSSLSPVLLFSLRTANFQQRLALGLKPSGSQIIKEFGVAWSEFANYKPVYRMSDDTAWYFGRLSSRFWVDRLSALGNSGDDDLTRVLTDSTGWVTAAYAYQGWKDLKPEDLLFRSDELQGLTNLVLSNLDVAIYVYEQRPAILATEEAGFEGNLNTFLTTLGSYAEFLNLNSSEAGFPPFTLTNSTHIQELKARLKYLIALDPRKPAQQRLTELQAVLPMMGQLELPESYIDYHLSLGRQLKTLGRGDLALTAWQRALTKAKETSFVSKSIDAASLLAEEYESLGEWKKTSEYAAFANQGFRDELGSSDTNVLQAKTEKSNGLSVLAAKAHIKSNNPQQALAVLSEGHQVNSAAVQLSGNKEAKKATAELQTKKKQVAILTQKVNELKSMPESATRNELINKTATVLAQTKSEFLLQSRNIRQKFAKLYTTSLRFDPLNLPDVQKALPANAAVVQYFATDDELYIFVVTPTQFRLRSVPRKKVELDKMIVSYLRMVQRPGPNNPNLDRVSKSLYETLVTPIEQDLEGASTVVLIPSGKLNILPFGALTDAAGKTFLEKKTLLELAKTTDFMKIANSQAKPVKTIVAFANATLDLPAAELEGENITAMFPNSRLFKRGEASKENLKQFGGTSDVLHFATHGTWDASNSLNNHLKLSNNETLAQEEIFNLNLDKTSIVTLSACNTAVADSKDVAYVASLAEAFWIAGSQSVVASLWPVDDTSTGILMTAFYRELKAGVGKAEALRKAQLTLAENPKFSHPYFWSGFLLFGDYR